LRARGRALPGGGTPIEEAPLWALAILAILLWLVAFPASVGLLDGIGLRDVPPARLALGAAAITVLLVAGLRLQKSWRRATGRAPHPLDDRRPPFVRLSTWVFTTLLFPNVLHGALLLALRAEGRRIDYATSWAIGLLVSAIQGGLGLVDRWRRRRAAVRAL
jgi:hypothetical protein